MWLIVVEDGIAEHGGGGRVADIQAHPHSAMEQLNREMVGVAVVEKHTGTLASLHHQGEVERSRGVEGVQLDVGVGSCKLDGGQVLATLARIAWVALASIGRWRGGKTGAMSARSSLAWRSLLVGRHLECRKINQSKEEKTKVCSTSTLGEDSQNTPEYPGGQTQEGGPIVGLLQCAPC